ncbi:MAG: GNAT family N-acetyltransferase [Myxococcales bacterium]
MACAVELIDLALEKPEQKDYVFLVADDGGQVLGYICYGPTPMTDATWDLYWVAAAPEARGKGVGKALVREMEADLRARKARQIRIETSSQEAYGSTRDFYARNQFVEQARLRDFYKPGDDLVILGKRYD